MTHSITIPWKHTGEEATNQFPMVAQGTHAYARHVNTTLPLLYHDVSLTSQVQVLNKHIRRTSSKSPLVLQRFFVKQELPDYCKQDLEEHTSWVSSCVLTANLVRILSLERKSHSWILLTMALKTSSLGQMLTTGCVYSSVLNSRVPYVSMWQQSVAHSGLTSNICNSLLLPESMNDLL